MKSIRIKGDKWSIDTRSLAQTTGIIVRERLELIGWILLGILALGFWTFALAGRIAGDSKNRDDAWFTSCFFNAGLILLIFIGLRWAKTRDLTVIMGVVVGVVLLSIGMLRRSPLYATVGSIWFGRYDFLLARANSSLLDAQVIIPNSLPLSVGFILGLAYLMVGLRIFRTYEEGGADPDPTGNLQLFGIYALLVGPALLLVSGFIWFSSINSH